MINEQAWLYIDRDRRVYIIIILYRVYNKLVGYTLHKSSCKKIECNSSMLSFFIDQYFK